MKKTEFISLAQEFGWTKADAIRALSQSIPDREIDSELDALRILAQFSGSELAERQRLQGAQKGQVTKHKNLIQKIQDEHRQQLQVLEADVEKQRSTFVPIIAKLYGLLRPFGLQDPWVEALLESYKDYLVDPEDDQLKRAS